MTMATLATVDAGYELSLWGWVVMLLSVGFVTGLLSWCIWRVMRESRPDKVHAPLDFEIENRDES